MTDSRVTSVVNRIIDLFSGAFTALDAGVSMRDIESLAAFVHHSMDDGRRRYHRSSHLLDLSPGLDPRQTLAALFHDVVYCQVDGGLTRRAQPILSPLLVIEPDGLSLKPSSAKDRLVAMCLDLFRFKPGQDLPIFDGMNEFLSAVVAVRLLEPHLPVVDLLVIAAMIEATIPFRGKTVDGKDAFVARAEKLAEVASSVGVVLSPTEVDGIMRDAVELANRDVASFSAADPSRFLASTWLLLEESNAPLAAVGVYSVRDYREALVRMEVSLRDLDTDHVFHHYDNVPNADALALLQSATRKNVAFACDYLGVKILGIAIIEALTLVSGGDCPVSMMLGDIHGYGGKPQRVEDFLPAVSTGAGSKVDPDLMRVLKEGRAWESGADLNTSPLSAFLYESLGAERSRSALANAKRMMAGVLSPLDFLRTLDQDLVRGIIEACAPIAVSRRARLEALTLEFLD
jgi:hypothetical protein